ncbi:hypothetical protein J18TS1_27560 [Oceanobacillus oncorhynchi subsp. incaldanensis]|uniref:hypothetical protein n=1 Tax=Oceanobacillus oncorhynchi TaxID=545501 RepID=UPI001B1A6E57|nr:hypothetical protein [Oceanobacillus oncorhynchi]GIO19656.1 hypothetical protein J18TS1_27560 [Oceanobacillus oncorhynchi subsp. incaldanensis]
MSDAEKISRNENSCESILDTAKTIYNEESERFKQAENKTNIAIAFVGILFGSYLTYLGSFDPVTEEAAYLIYTFSFKFLIFILLSASAGQLLKAIRTGKYDQVSLEAIVNDELSREDANWVKLQIAATYKEAIDLNKELLEKKMDIYSKGLNLVLWGFTLFVIHFIVEEVIKIV